MINFVIVEDNKNHKKHVKDLIVSFMMKNKIDFNISDFDDYNKELKQFIKSNKGDKIYLLDLELPNGDGIDIAKLVRNTYNDWKSPIIICTAHTSLAYEVYKQRLQILDFIGKCVDADKNILESLEICLKMLNKYSFYRYTYHNVDYCISYDAIDYIQRDGRRTSIVTKDKIYYQNISINEIKKLLPSNFVVSTKGTLINMNNVCEIDWKELIVHFKDGKFDYVVCNRHKKEIVSYGVN